MQFTSSCRMHCGAFASGDDLDEAVQPRTPCNHNINPCNLGDITYCTFIAPDLMQGDVNRCFGCSNTRNETKKWKNSTILYCSLLEGCPMWIHDKCLKDLTLGSRSSANVQCRYHTEILDRHQHPDECHSCNSIYDYLEDCKKLVALLSVIYDR